MYKKILLILLSLIILATGCGKKENKNEPEKEEKEENVIVDQKVDIINLDSTSRPYAVVINNYPSAVKVQTGLNEAYMVYEIPIEGGMSRSVAFYKDIADLKIGTIRSARHNYLDYVLEHDAIFVHFGWSKQAKKDISDLKIDYIDGNSRDPSVFWRENPESLSREHTVYTNLSKIITYRNFRKETQIKPPLNYSTTDVDLSSYKDSKKANSIEFNYSKTYRVKFLYNEETGKYDRYVNDKQHQDYFQNKPFTTENIIVILLDWGYTSNYVDAAGNNYLDLHNTGSGKGYYITNGYAKEITWEKKNRSSQTVYKYQDGTPVNVSDGNTYVMLQSKTLGVSIK